MATVHRLRRGGPELSDSELVTAARAGEAWAQEALFRRYSHVVYGMAFRLTGPDEAKDIAQDTWIQAFRALGGLLDPSAFRSWLCGVTVRVVRRRSRRYHLLARFRSYGGEDPVFQEAVDQSARPDVAAELKQVYALLERLPPKERLVFLLRRVEGMKLEEIAVALDASLASVKRWLTKAQERVDELSSQTRGETEGEAP